MCVGSHESYVVYKVVCLVQMASQVERVARARESLDASLRWAVELGCVDSAVAHLLVEAEVFTAGLAYGLVGCKPEEFPFRVLEAAELFGQRSPEVIWSEVGLSVQQAVTHLELVFGLLEANKVRVTELTM